MRLFRGVLPALLIAGSFTVFSQSIISPYSNYGLGEISDFSLPHNEAMGGLGIGTPEVYNINTQNPAFLPYNFLTSFQVGFKMDFRRYIGGEGNTSGRTGSLRYIGLSFPLITNKWASSITLLPFSSVNYNIVGEQILEETGELVENRFDGSGGLSQVNWSHGFNVYKDFKLGLRASYVFGAIDKGIQNIISGEEDADDFSVIYQDNVSYSDMNFAVAFGHSFKISESRAINYGGVLEIPTKLSGKRNSKLSRFTSDGSIELPGALIINEDLAVEYEIPMNLGLGISYESGNQLQFGLDVKYRNWENSKNAAADSLRNTLGITLGGKIVPDYNSVNNYLQRVHYRFGLQYKQLPYMVNGTEINEFGINFGVSLPVSGVSSLDTAFKFGWRGTTDNDLVRESFYQIVFGLTINDRWFIKRRYD